MYRRLLDKFFPLQSKRRNFLFYSKKKIKKILLRNKKRITNLNGDYEVYDYYAGTTNYSKPLKSLNKKIAVHLHLYYEDLKEEMLYYLNNMPYSFDLYISVQENTNTQEIKKYFEKVKNVSKVVVENSKNSGRDYGPMMVLFGKKLKKYDYIGHIHTKKSLRYGISQDGWRKHLLNGVLGSPSLIKNIFYELENDNVGMFFPDSNKESPYWGNTWLGVSSMAREVCSKLNIPYTNNYLDFSVGSMFWINQDACKNIFNYTWTWNDFGLEKGLNDGTLAYVFERLFTLSVKASGYDFVCYNDEKNIFYKNFSERNMYQYYEKDKEYLYNKLKEYDVISFDIFDTLVCRKIYEPDDLFLVVENSVKDIIKNFKKLRKEAESKCYLDNKQEPTIDDIYDKFRELAKLSKDDTLKIKECEINTELEYLIPRKDILEVYNKLIADNKECIMVSDMYLTSKILKTILEKCGYKNYKKIYVSCELKKRKDQGNIWEEVLKNYQGKTFIHIGDNEESDVHKLWDLDIKNEHIMQGLKMFSQTKYGYGLSKFHMNDNLNDSILYGLIINKCLFNSPFKFYNTKNRYLIENTYEFGYSVVGPIILKYLLWVIENTKDLKNTELLFLSREGYYLKPLYDLLIKVLQIDNNPDSCYFLTSRRCVTMSSVEKEEDILSLLDIEYYGDFVNFMYYRFGIKVDTSNFKVTLTGKKDDGINNYEEVKNKVLQYKQDILDRAKKEKKEYLSYIRKTIKNMEKKNLIVIDLGYSGTTQLYLYRLLNKNISGKYLVVKNDPKPLKAGLKVDSCYNNIYNDNRHILYLNSLFLEAFLTAPNGQLMYFEKGKPVYIDEKSIPPKLLKLEEIYNGVKELFIDYCTLVDKKNINYSLNTDKLISLYSSFLNESNKFTENNKELFRFDDYYCRSEEMIIEKQ